MTDDVLPFPFATVQDLQDRWPDMPPGSDSYAATLLEDVSHFILGQCPSAGDASAHVRKMVAVAVVKRAMSVPAELAGLESTQITAGPLSQSFRPADGGTDFYLRKAEKQLLGCGGQRASEVDLLSGSRQAHADYAGGDPGGA